jgi:hypothetical protein
VGMAQLGDKGGFLELSDGTEDLANELGGRARVGEVARRVGGHQFDAALAQELVTGKFAAIIPAAVFLPQRRPDR